MNHLVKEEGRQESLAAVARSPLGVPVLIAGIVTALVIGVVVIAEQYAPRPAWRFLPAVIFLVALEAIFTTRWLHDPRRRLLNRPAFRLAEAVFILFILRFLAWGLTGGLPDWVTLEGYLWSPLTFFDQVFFVYLVCGLFAWERSNRFAGQFSRLALSPAEIHFYSLPAAQRRQQFEDRPVDRMRPHIFADFIKSWLNGAALIAFIAAITTVDMGTVPDGLRTVRRLGLQPEMLGALLVYFIGGFVLVSHARFVVMHARWVSDGVEATPRLMRNWRRASVALIVGVAFFAALLPIGSTFGLARLLEMLLGLILFLFQLVLYLLALVTWLVSRLIGAQGGPPGEEPAPPERLLPQDLVAPPPAGTSSIPILGAIFWAIIAIVTVASLLFFLRERGFQLQGNAILSSLWANLAGWFASFWQATAERAAAAQEAVRSRLQRPKTGEQSGRPWRFFRLGALPPREQIRYFYLSTVRRAGDRGVAREESETPSEFAQDLKSGWPEAASEIEQLTDAFLEARYSREEIETEDASLAKTVWKEVRSALRRKQLTRDNAD